jgi:HAD superfamily hydrolase (TIGR01450 family)
MPGECPLVELYDVALLDLDGVVYTMGHAIPHAVEALAAAELAGMRRRFVTNNASRRASEIAELLTGLGVPTSPEEIITSAQSAAALLARRLPGGAPVLVVGAPALAVEVAEVGLTPVDSADGEPLAVVQGFGPDVDWRLLAEGAVAVGRGALWVATNADAAQPSPRGQLPGNGALVAALATTLGREPDVVVGKPGATLVSEAIRRSNARKPLMIGDNLDTDIAGAHAAGIDSLLVLTGVTSREEAKAAMEQQAPTYIGEDLRALHATSTAIRR